MITTLTAALLGASLVLLGTDRSWALSPETTMLLDLLKTKGVITPSEGFEFTKTIEGTMSTPSPAEIDHHHSVQSRADRTEHLEAAGQKQQNIGNKIRLSGLLEAEMTTSRTKEVDGTESNSSDLTLATAQLNADAAINHYVSGRMVFLFEEGENNDTIAIDEAIIVINGGDDSPLSANVGRQYLPFGRFESHFITNPGTLILGETNDTAAVTGLTHDIFELTVGASAGKVKQSGNNGHINNVAASASLTAPAQNEGRLSLSGGVSYLTNLAASDSLEAETTTAGEIADLVDGWSAYISLGYGDRFFFDAEYLGAIKDFVVNDFSFTDAENLRPEAWNFEAATRICETAELAFRYGGSDGAGSFLSRDEYGAALLYNVRDAINLTIEYLHQNFMDTGDNTQGTIQLAIEF